MRERHVDRDSPVIAEHVDAVTCIGPDDRPSLEPLISRGAGDSQFTNLRSDVERDIAAGERPDVAVQRRSATIVRGLDSRPVLAKPPAGAEQ